MWITSGLILDVPKVVLHYTKKRSALVFEQLGEDGIPLLVKMNADTDRIHATQLCWCHLVNIWHVLVRCF